jgi:UDP-3-O-[3-hydroxymyristoyl] glucosamine N-acyltransferase
MPENTRKKITLAEFACLIEGSLDSEGDCELTGIAAIQDAKPGDLTFLSGAKNYARHLENLKQTKAVAVIIPENAPQIDLPAVRLKNPYYGLVKALEFFHPEQLPDFKIHATAYVSEDAQIADDVVVGPYAVVEAGAVVGAGTWLQAQSYVGPDVVVGQNCRIFPGVRLLKDSKLGDECIIHSNTVLGSDGFGFTPHNGEQLKVPQIGNVVVGDRVEIGSAVTIDRATMGSTIIGNGTKIDNMVHVAHNCVIGKNCTIVAQVGISGSTVLEDNVTLAGQVGTVGHVRVGKGTVVAARGVVTADVEPGSFVSGFPLKPHGEERRILASLRKLPDLVKKVRQLEKIMAKKEE